MPNEWSAEELEAWWDRFHGVPSRGVATLEEQDQLASEADKAGELVLLDVAPGRRRPFVAGAAGVVLAILAAIAYAKFVLWLPRVGRLLQ